MRSKIKFLLLLFILCMLLPQSLNASAATANTWSYEDGAWYHYDSQGNRQTGWQKINGCWFYLNSDGVMQTGWQKINGFWYYLAPGGSMQTGWQKISGKWYYLAPSGAMKTGWQLISGKWYYLAPSGAMQTGWQKIGGKWYYFAPGGAMQTGFKDIGGKRYYMNSKGVMLTNWQCINGKWYYFSPGGAMQTGWQKIGSKWYYFESDGKRATGFKDIGGKRYYLNGKGVMLTGWQCINDKWYYFASGGAMQTGWLKRFSKWYYYNVDGSMQYGWLTIGERSYYLADQNADIPASGEMLRGFHVIGGKAYCFESNGSLQKDWTAKNVIVIDPGHSSEIPDWQVPVGPGSDEMKDADNLGATGIKTGVHEYELVLDVSLKLRDKLESRGYKVVMVRTTNSGVYSCVDRAKVANDNNAAVFLRVHANSDLKNLSKTGAMTICITKDNEFISKMYQKSRLLSDQILNSYVSATGCYSEGVWERDDMIANNWSKVPTTLIELGYMSNEKEDVLMQTTEYQEKMVNGMLSGIDNYFRAVYK